MKVFSTIFRYILVIILTILIIAMAFIGVASSTILNKQFVLSKLEETGYYDGIYQEIQSDFEKYVGQSGLDENVLQDVLTKEKIKSDVNVIINNIYEGTNEEFDVEELKENLNNKIQQTIEEQGLRGEQESIDSYIDTICEQYKQTMLHTNYEKDINDIYNKVTKYIQAGKKIVMVASLVVAIIIIAICFRHVFKGFASCAISLTASGIFLTVVNMYINSKVKIDTITVFNSTISNTIREIMSNIVGQIANCGYIMLAIGIIVIIVGNLIDSFMNKED